MKMCLVLCWLDNWLFNSKVLMKIHRRTLFDFLILARLKLREDSVKRSKWSNWPKFMEKVKISAEGFYQNLRKDSDWLAYLFDPCTVVGETSWLIYQNKMTLSLEQ